MNSWERLNVYAKQKGVSPYGNLTITDKQARRYIKKWKREFGDEAWQRYVKEYNLES